MVQPDGALTSGLRAAVLSRLSWPSVLVRERACTAIAKCLTSEEHEAWMSDLLYWISQARLETLAANGLLVLVKAKMLGSPFIPAREEVDSVIVSPSLLSTMLLESIYGLSDDSGVRSLHSGTAPDSFLAPPDFEDCMSTFIAPIFGDFGKRLDERVGGIMFTRHWSWEWTCLKDRWGLLISRGTPHYTGRQHDKNLRCTSFPGSELYRSAFLRSLAWALFEGRIDWDVARYFTGKTCPIDLTLWCAESESKPPKFWPKCVPSSGQVHTRIGWASAAAKKLCESLSEGSGDESVVFAQGALPGSGSKLWLRLGGFLQRSAGPIAPIAKDILDACDEMPAAMCNSGQALSLQGPLFYFGAKAGIQSIADWELFPLFTLARGVMLPTWEYWRVERGLYFLNPCLFDSTLFVIEEAGRILFRSEAKEVGRWRDWVECLDERIEAELPQVCGQVATIKVSELDIWRNASQANLVYVWEVSEAFRENTYEEYNIHKVSGLVGGSQLIIPL